MLKDKLRVLLVDDDEDDFLLAEELLQESCPGGVSVQWSQNYQQAVEVLKRDNFDVLLFDYQLGPDSGLDLTKWVAAQNITSPVILLTGMDNHEIDLEAMHCGATDYLVKRDLNAQVLERSIRYAIRQKTDELKLVQLAHYDPLTGLCNRSLFQKRLLDIAQHSQRSRQNFAVFTLDLDHFKNINDTLGHERGDELLIAVAKILYQCCRETDTVARLGGDEFTIIATHLAGKDSAQGLATKLIEAFVAPIELAGQRIKVGVSIGIAQFPLDANDNQELLRLSDIALYQAKSSGRNTFCFYDEEQNKNAHEQALLQHEIAQSIEAGHFQLYYQPVVEIKTGYPMYVEALMRWQHPQNGFIPPDKFIPVMELSSDIITMGEWAIREAAQQHVKWRQRGLPPISIAVNISARQFASSSLLQTIHSAIETYQLESTFLTLELTESVLMPTQQVLATLKELQKIGIKVSIDDFGTGYSSLAYLKRFKVNTLKIDREFIKDLPQDEESAAITSAIIALGKALKLKLVAEGIETVQQQQLLCDKHCDFGQGYLFAKPMPGDDLFDWYSQCVRELN